MMHGHVITAGGCRKRVLVDGYPYLVLQLSSAEQPMIRIKMAEVVAHFSHRPDQSRCEKARPVLCHYDVKVPYHGGLNWQPVEATTSWEQPMPIRHRCFSKMCCSPLCLLYSTQSYNARTGRMRQQQQTRQARGGRAQPGRA